MCLREIIYKVLKIYDKTTNKPVEYEIEYITEPEYHEKNITIRFGIKIKNTDTKADVTLVLYRRKDGTLTGKHMLAHTHVENLEFKVDLKSIPLHELEEKLYKQS